MVSDGRDRIEVLHNRSYPKIRETYHRICKLIKLFTMRLLFNENVIRIKVFKK